MYNLKAYKIYLLLTFYILLCTFVNAQEGYLVKNIKFEGNKIIPNKSLKQQILLRRQSFIRNLLFWKEAHLYAENILQRDIKRLIRYYQTEGFMNIVVTSKLVVNEKKQKVEVVFQINEGIPTLINQVNFEFETEDIQNANDIIKKIKPNLLLKSGTRFRDLFVSTDRQLLFYVFNDEGYAYAEIDIQLSLLSSENKVDVTYNIDTGPKCSFGQVEISGNKLTPTKIIRSRIEFKEGKVYNQKRVQKTQNKIYQLGMFQFVTVKVQMMDKQPALPVQIMVRESPRLTTKFGVGYGREDFFRTFIDLQRLGFLGDIRRLSVFAKHSGLEPYHFNIKFTQPGFITYRTSFMFNPFFKQEKEPGYTIDRGGSNFSLQHRFTEKMDGYINYGLERDYLKVSQITREAVFQNSEIKLYNKSGITLGWARDSSTPAFSPDAGTFSAITYTLSGIGFKSDFHFMRILLELRRYRKITDNFSFAYRMKIGGMKPTEKDSLTPIEERFYAGGSNSVRGWERSQLGPKSEENKPIGGLSYLEGSAELRYPLWRKLSGVIFLDSGNVWSESFQYELKRLRYASGVGLRFRTPIGPIRFDVATPVFEGIKLQPQFHISVGQSF